jgi:hypothetical protein
MTGTAARLANSRRPGWLSVLLCCLLSLTGPFNLSTVYQVLDSTLSAPNPAGPCIEAQDIDDDEEDLLQPVSAADGRRFERKQAAPVGASLTLCPAFSARKAPRTRLSRSLGQRSGSEHAFRNGCGTPLLC